MRQNILRLIGLGCLVILINRANVFSQQVSGKPEDYVGEFSAFGVRVPASNYNFIKMTIQLFGNRWGETAQNDDELSSQAWDQLLLSYEAFKRDIKVEDSEAADEVTKTLKSEKVDFDWQKEPEKFEKWCKEKISVPPEFFKNQFKHMLQLEKLRKQILDSFTPTVTEDEAKKEFINEYNTLELELVQFDKLEDAKNYYGKMQDSALWDAEAQKDPKFAKHPGFVSFEFLINMWKIPKDDLYKMITMEVNTIYPPTPIYKGYGVFRILKKRVADENEFPKVRDSYFKQVEMMKKYDSLKEWLKKYRQDAKLIVYPRSEVEKKEAVAAPK
jgi:hypothetical protein